MAEVLRKLRRDRAGDGMGFSPEATRVRRMKKRGEGNSLKNGLSNGGAIG
jgi:hypothetical protein